MPMFLGMVLGAALTVLTAFMIDSMTPPATSANGTTNVETRQMVNWDVVGARMRGLRDEIRHFGAQVQHGWNKLTG